jgi:hypothetical protein
LADRSGPCLSPTEVESSLAPEETPPHDGQIDSLEHGEDGEGSHDPSLSAHLDAEVDQLDTEQPYHHQEQQLDPQPLESVEETGHPHDPDALATYLEGSAPLATLDSSAAPLEDDLRQGLPSLPVLPSADYQPPHFSYPTSDYVPTTEHTSAPEQYYPSADQPAYPSYPSYPSYGDVHSTGDASTEAGSSSAHASTWTAAHRGFDSYGSPAPHAHGDSSSAAQPYYPQDPSGGEPAFAELVQQHSTSAVGSNYYLNYPGEEGGSQVGAFGQPGADDEELEPAEHLEMHEGGDNQAKKRTADGKLKKDGDKPPRTPGQKAPPKEVKLGPDGKPKIELACHPCRQRKIRLAIAFF